MAGGRVCKQLSLKVGGVPRSGGIIKIYTDSLYLILFQVLIS